MNAVTGWNRVVCAKLADGIDRLANELEFSFSGERIVLPGPCSSRNEVTSFLICNRQATPQNVSDEGNDRLEKSQCGVESMSENRARNLAIVAVRREPAFRRLEIPVSELIPDE